MTTTELNTTHKIGVIGAGAMGTGIAQVAASAGHKVLIYDNNQNSMEKASQHLQRIILRLTEKEKITASQGKEILSNIDFVGSLEELAEASLVIEAIVEDLQVKKNIFSHLELFVNDTCILASNTSSLSIASIASACTKPQRVLGIHFFNPAPLMPLVEIIPGVQTSDMVVDRARALIDAWGKQTVKAIDTPGFIVNRVARPFYGEALRILEEGIADVPTIDWAMKEIGGFKMGPFELMDYIGNDINYVVTETIFKEFFYDPRYKPSFTQKRMVEAGLLGRKTEMGYYDYSEGAAVPEANKDQKLGEQIVWRVLIMLINEAAEALYLNISTRDEIDLAMTKGVNYPKGLLKWADDEGIENVLFGLERLQSEYGEDRYRPSLMLRKLNRENTTFYNSTLVEQQ